MPPLPPAIRPDGPTYIGTFERIVQPVVDRDAVGGDISERTNGAADARQAAYQAAEYHRHMSSAGAQWWRNADYLVQATLADAAGLIPSDAPSVLWLRIYRHDGETLPNHWQALQAIKSELIGPEFEAVEIYPRESRLKDGENSYHLWVPLGWLLHFGLPGARSATADGSPAVSTRFVRPAPTAQDDRPYCRLIASGIDVSKLKAVSDSRVASGGYRLASARYHVVDSSSDEKTGVEVKGGLVEHVLDCIEPYLGRPRVEVLNLLRMAPGDEVPPHIDPPQPQQVGSPMRLHLVISAEPGCKFTIGDETIEHRPGDLWQIRGTNSVRHHARNQSGADRTIACFNVTCSPDQRGER